MRRPFTSIAAAASTMCIGLTAGALPQGNTVAGGGEAPAGNIDVLKPETQIDAAAPEPAPDYTQRCTALAESRADDAKQLGASKADQQKMQADVYENCLKQSVKPGYPP